MGTDMLLPIEEISPPLYKHDGRCKRQRYGRLKRQHNRNHNSVFTNGERLPHLLDNHNLFFANGEKLRHLIFFLVNIVTKSSHSGTHVKNMKNILAKILKHNPAQNSHVPIATSKCFDKHFINTEITAVQPRGEPSIIVDHDDHTYYYYFESP